MKKYIDTVYSTEDSLPLRYLNGISSCELSQDDLRAICLREGARICHFTRYKDVSIFLVDETTLMASGTFKTLEACLTVALCKKKGYDKVVFSSGANYGSAVTLYAQKAGIETFFFHPKSTLWKLDGRLFKDSTAHLISVNKPEKEVKKAALLFSEMFGIKHIPEKEWRLMATGLRAFFVFEFMLKNQIRFHWLSQAVCAGYGPIGFYNKASQLLQEEMIGKNDIPKFLGIQQTALSPMVRAWNKRHDHILPEDITDAQEELLVPALYNANPGNSYSQLYKYLNDYGGCLSSVDREEFEEYAPFIINKLNEIGIKLTSRNIDGKEVILEKAGLLGLVGVLKAINQGIIKKGECLLVFFTGGAGAHSGDGAISEYEVREEDGLVESVHNYLNQISVLSL